MRRSIGGTPWRTPPKDREARRLDERYRACGGFSLLSSLALSPCLRLTAPAATHSDDKEAPVDTQTLIARALRKKFAGADNRARRSSLAPLQNI